MGRNECAEFQSSSVNAPHRQTPVHHVPPIQLEDLEGSSQSVGRQQGAPVKTHIGLVDHAGDVLTRVQRELRELTRGPVAWMLVESLAAHFAL